MRWALTLIAVAVTAWLGLKSGHWAGHVPAVWWANSVLLAIVLLSPRQDRWHLLFAGYFGNAIAHLLMRDPVSQMVLLSLCDIGETTFALLAVQWSMMPETAHQERGIDLMDRGRLLRFVLFGVLLGPLIAACLAYIILQLLVGAQWITVVHWFPPSALGMAIVAPLILALARRETHALFTRQRIVKTLIWMGLLAIITLVIFSRNNFALLFLLFPPLMLLVVELGVGGGALGSCIVAAIGSVYTAREYGVLASGTQNATFEQRILILQTFLATAVLSVNIVGLVLGDLKRAVASTEAARNQLRATLAALESVAHIDPTTRIASRRRFDEVFQTEWSRAARDHTHLSLLLFDIDHFKSYNDCYGHIAGDECLRQLAKIASGTLHRPGDLIARFGGEEFAIILPNTPSHGAAAIAEQVRGGIQSACIAHGETPDGMVTVSIGCATAVPWRDGASMMLLAAADGALYVAKRAGRNAVQTAALLVDSGIRTVISNP